MSSRHQLMQTNYTSFGDVRVTPGSLLQEFLSIFNGPLRAAPGTERQIDGKC